MATQRRRSTSTLRSLYGGPARRGRARPRTGAHDVPGQVVTSTADGPLAEGADPPGPHAMVPRSWFGPWVLVALAVAWGLWELRPELRAVPYLDDSSLHEQMVRSAATRIGQGHLPLTSWFPYLGLGSPQFLHYQSLPSMISGSIGTVVDPDTVFRWSLYLLLALWPLAVYCERPAVRPEPLDRRRGRRGGAVPRLGGRHRLRDQGLRLGGLRRVDPALGRRGRCRWRGASPTAPCRRCAPRCPPSSSSC